MYFLHLQNAWKEAEEGNDEADGAQGHVRSDLWKMELCHRRLKYIRLTSVITNQRNGSENLMSLLNISATVFYLYI